jgi:sulfatase maturation enzyme AslB (radical SAM superfamily)
VSLDGIGDIHEQVRAVKNGFAKATRTIAAMQALAKTHENFSFGIAATIFATNMPDAENILAWARTQELDVVFNMLRFTDAMLHNKDLEEKIGFHTREEQFMRKFFLDRVQEESVLSGQAFMYLHYADMIANGYQRTMPCLLQSRRSPTERRSALLRELGEARKSSTTRPSALFEAQNLAPAASEGQGPTYASARARSMSAR